MKKMIVTAAAVGLGMFNASAVEADVNLSADATFGSGFVANGITWVDGPVFMPSATVAVDSKDGNHHTSLTYWTCVNLDDTIGYDNMKDETGNITEWDIFADYTYTGLELFDLSVGGIYYAFPKIGGTYTTDIYAAAKMNVFLNPAVTLLYDVDGSNAGFHGDFGISHGYDFESGVSVGAWAKVVFADGEYGAAYYSDDGENTSGIMSYGCGLNASYAVTEHVSVGAGLSLWKLANSDGVLGMTNEEWESIDVESPSDSISGTVSISYAF